MSTTGVSNLEVGILVFASLFGLGLLFIFGLLDASQAPDVSNMIMP